MSVLTFWKLCPCHLYLSVDCCIVFQWGNYPSLMMTVVIGDLRDRGIISWPTGEGSGAMYNFYHHCTWFWPILQRWIAEIVNALHLGTPQGDTNAINEPEKGTKHHATIWLTISQSLVQANWGRRGNCSSVPANLGNTVIPELHGIISWNSRIMGKKHHVILELWIKKI